MRVVVTSGERQVQIKVKGSGRKALRQVEKTARRLLAETPPPDKPMPFGFATANTEATIPDGD